MRTVLLDFLWDNASLNYSTLLEMPNPNYQPEKRRIAAAPLQRVVRRIRICAGQWFMRRIQTWERVRTHGQLLCRYGRHLPFAFLGAARAIYRTIIFAHALGPGLA